jgi:hypothetical protein
VPTQEELRARDFNWISALSVLNQLGDGECDASSAMLPIVTVCKPLLNVTCRWLTFQLAGTRPSAAEGEFTMEMVSARAGSLV